MLNVISVRGELCKGMIASLRRGQSTRKIGCDVADLLRGPSNA